MIEASALVPVSDKEFDDADATLASLSELAYAAPKPKPRKPKVKRRSRFFFRLSPSFAQRIDSMKEQVKPKEINYVDHEVTARLKQYKKEVPPELSSNIDKVREFFLCKVGPLSLATAAGATQAREVVQRLLATEVDATQFDKFERMSQAAVNIKMARFVARYFNLPKSEAQAILDSIMPKQPPAIVPIPTPVVDRERRHERAKERKEGKED